MGRGCQGCQAGLLTLALADPELARGEVEVGQIERDRLRPPHPGLLMKMPFYTSYSRPPKGAAEGSEERG
jgi:hypothetical protein